jgi:hypothetical protein
MGQAPIAYVFEAGDRHRGRLMERMEQDAFPPPIFLPKKDVVRDGVLYPGFTPLQAADILAYEHFSRDKAMGGHAMGVLGIGQVPTRGAGNVYR